MSSRDLLDLLNDRYLPHEIVEKMNLDPDVFMSIFGSYIQDNLEPFEDDLREFFE